MYLKYFTKYKCSCILLTTNVVKEVKKYVQGNKLQINSRLFGKQWFEQKCILQKLRNINANIE